MFLKDGYTVQGSICVSSTGVFTTFYQAVFKPEVLPTNEVVAKQEVARPQNVVTRKK